tara:strand:- start:993 stop:1151 length:159 start_codon:yes stop_codon:yes gene_type:complete
VGHLYEQYKQEVANGSDSGKVMNKFGLERYCCRGVLLGNVDLIETVAEFKKF